MAIYRHPETSWKVDQIETSWKLYGAILDGYKFIPSGWNFYPERLKLILNGWNILKPPELPLNIPVESRLKVDRHPETSWRPPWTILNDWKSVPWNTGPTVLKHPETSKICMVPSWNRLKDWKPDSMAVNNHAFTQYGCTHPSAHVVMCDWAFCVVDWMFWITLLYMYTNSSSHVLRG